LEAELDLQLFDRATRKALPTAAALALEPQARQVICQLNALDAQALQLHKGLEKRLSIAMAPELQTGNWSQPLERLAQEFPNLQIELRSASQTEAVRMLHEGSVQLALVFERPGIDERESFLEAGSQLLVAIASPRHPVAQGNGVPLSEEQLAKQRQIIVTSGTPTGSDPRIVLSRQIWLTDSYLATLDLVQSGLGLPAPAIGATSDRLGRLEGSALRQTWPADCGCGSMSSGSSRSRWVWVPNGTCRSSARCSPTNHRGHRPSSSAQAP